MTDDIPEYPGDLGALAATLDTIPAVLATDVHCGSPTGDWLEVCVGDPYVPPQVLVEIGRAGMCVTEVAPKGPTASITNVREPAPNTNANSNHS